MAVCQMQYTVSGGTAVKIKLFTIVIKKKKKMNTSYSGGQLDTGWFYQSTILYVY